MYGQGEPTGVVRLDFPKVFGKVPQQRLLKKGSRPGTGDEVLTGRKHLLKGKKQKVEGNSLRSREHQRAVQGLRAACSKMISKSRQILKFAANTEGSVDEDQLWKETGQ